MVILYEKIRKFQFRYYRDFSLCNFDFLLLDTFDLRFFFGFDNSIIRWVASKKIQITSYLTINVSHSSKLND